MRRNDITNLPTTHACAHTHTPQKGERSVCVGGFVVVDAVMIDAYLPNHNDSFHNYLYIYIYMHVYLYIYIYM